MATCIKCNTTENLNVTIGVNHELVGKLNVHVCDECSEDISPKICKQLFEERNAEKIEFLKKAQELSIPIDRASVLAGIPEIELPKQAVRPNNRPSPQITPQQTIEAEPQNEDDPNMVSMDMLSRYDSKVTYEENVPPAMPAHSFVFGNSEDSQAANKLRNESKASLQVVEAEDSKRQIILPKKIKSGIGDTNIDITPTGGDRALQERFKRMAAGNSSFGNYQQTTTVKCTTCRGKGRTMNKRCPKCNGTGSITV